jgi:hypothetical protein
VSKALKYEIKEQVNLGYKLINENPDYDHLMDSFQSMYRK